MHIHCNWPLFRDFSQRISLLSEVDFSALFLWKSSPHASTTIVGIECKRLRKSCTTAKCECITVTTKPLRTFPDCLRHWKGISWLIQYCGSARCRVYAVGHAAVFAMNVALVAMGGGTFFKVGGTNARWKEIIENFVVWIGNCDVTSIKIWRHYIYTISRSKLHYFRENYTTMKTYRWTTWQSNKLLLQGRPRSSASLGLIIRFILIDWIKPFDACITEISTCFHSGCFIVALWRYVM